MLTLTSVFVTVFTLYFVHEVQAHGNGAPSSRCDSMLPGHWVSPQESISPFQIKIDKTVVSPGDRVNVTLSTVRGQPGIKGFLVMVKDLENDSVYGKFDLVLSDLKRAKPVPCSDMKDSAMTHVMNDVKNSVQLFWIAPDIQETSEEKELRVVGTFVKDFWTIWTDVGPEGDATLLLQASPASYNSHPKFQPPISSSADDMFRGDTPALIELDGESSWDHFKRAWNYAVSFFSP